MIRAFKFAARSALFHGYANEPCPSLEVYTAHGIRGVPPDASNHGLLWSINGPERDALAKQYCRGWFLGSPKAKKDLGKDLAEAAPMVNWEGVDLKELNEIRWEQIVQAELKRLKKKEDAIAQDPKGADWKVHIAKRLRKETTAKNPWIAERLQMGHPNYVSNLVNKA